MKKIKRMLSAFLAAAMVMQCGVTAFAAEPTERIGYSKDGVIYTYNSDGTVTATINASPVAKQTEDEPEEDRLADHGDIYENTSGDVNVTLEKTYTDGEALVSLECDGAGVVFYPETAVEANIAEEATVVTSQSDEPVAGDKLSEEDNPIIATEEIVEQVHKEETETDTNADATEDDLTAETVEPSEITGFGNDTVSAENQTPVSQDQSAPTPASRRDSEQPEMAASTETSEEIEESTLTPEDTEFAEVTASAETPETEEQTAEIPDAEGSSVPAENNEAEEKTVQAEPSETLDDSALMETPEAAEQSSSAEPPEPTEESVPIETPEPMEESLPVVIPAPVEEPAPIETENEEEGEEYEPIAIYDSVDGIGTGYAHGTYASVLYSGAINEFTDVELIPKRNGIKENIIMRQYTTSEISYVLNFSGLTPVLSGSSVLLYDSNGEQCGEISAPYLLDSKGVYNNNIFVSLDEIGSGYRLTYTMDEAWLQEASYPVVLDPSTYIGKDSDGSSESHMEDGYVTSDEPNRSYKGLTNRKMYCGNVYGESFCLFRPVLPDSINDIADCILVKDVKLHTYVESVSGSNTYSVYQLLGDWSSNYVTYNTCPAYTASNTPSHTISSTGWYTWDLTPAASTWFNSLAQMQEYGVLIRGSKNGGSLVFASSDASSDNAYYTITYYPVAQSNPRDPNLKVTAKGSGANSGTGYLELNWNKVEGAKNYYVGIHNGKEYEYFYVTGATSWTTKGKKIWPTEAEISKGRYRLHHDGKGAELPVIPAFSYNNSKGSLAGNLNYSVCVIPANQYGQAPNPKYFKVRTARMPDTLPPSQASTISVSPVSYTNANTITVKWSGIRDFNNKGTSAVTSLGTGHVQYSINNTTSWQNTASSNGSGSANINVSGVQDGRNVIYLRATDSTGNTSAPQHLYFFIDRTPPTVPAISVVPDNWSNKNSVSLTWSGISDANDLLRVEYAIDGGNYVTTGKADPSYAGYSIDTSGLTDGEHTLCVRAIDAIGNVGDAASVKIYKDTTAPSVSETVVDPESWTNADEASFGWTGLTDTHSGMSLVWYSVDGGNQIALSTDEKLKTTVDISTLSDGEHTLLLHFEDKVGNSKENSLTIYRDVTDPIIAILSPADGSAVNGAVEVLGSVHDISLESWTLIAMGEDGSEHVLASGNDEKDTERLGILNCALYEDGEKVELKLYAVDKAGNENEVTGTAIVVDKSAVPISGTVKITSPNNNEQITATTTDGIYTVDYTQEETEGLLYIDGVYQGNTSDKGFSFDAVTYAENSAHSMSVLSRAKDGTIQFSDGLSAYVLHSDAFEDDGLLVSYNGVVVDHGASLCGGSLGEIISQTITPSFPILALRLNVTEDKPEGTDISYYYSINDEEAWTAIVPGTDVPLFVRPNTIRLKAELTGNGTSVPALYGWTLQGAIETNPIRVGVKLARPVNNINVSTTAVSSALTKLVDQPKQANILHQYRDGAYLTNTFTYDAREVNDNEAHKVVLVAETEDGTLYGTGAKVNVLLRENVTASDTVISDALTAGGDLYALRLEALCSDGTEFNYSTDGSTWNAMTPGAYTYLDQAAKTVYLRAQGGTLTAWHVEGITCEEANVTAQIMKAPTNVVAADWGADYYADEAKRYYELSWTDPTPRDTTANYTTAYEIYRNGKLLDTTESTRYIDEDYTSNARYEVRSVRTYKVFSNRYSEKTAAKRTTMKAPERAIKVNYTAQEQKQSEYLDKLYGGNYTFSNIAKAPIDDRALNLSLLGRNKCCAYGWEPINFNTGNFLMETMDGEWTDLGLAKLSIDRTYNTQSDAADGPFGAHWSSAWSEHLRLYTEGDVVYTAADGAEITFILGANGVYSGGESRGLTLSLSSDSQDYLITSQEGEIHAFSVIGLLHYIQWSGGNKITLQRDEDGLVTGFTLPSGKTLNVESDKNGHITAITTPGGNTLKYEYQGNNLVQFTDANGGETRYVYDGQGRMTEWYDAEGMRQVQNTYDSKNRVIAQIDANGGEYALEYFDDHTVITDADAQVSEIWYDEQKRTTKTVDACGGEVKYEYDETGNIIAHTDENGNVTRYEYDANGNKIREIAPDGSSYSLSYDENNNLTQRMDQLGNVTRYEYDEHNRVICQTNPDGGKVSYAYNAAGQVLSVTDPLGGVTHYEYDSANLVKSIDPMGNVTDYTYDSENRLATTIDAIGNTTAFSYDAAGNLVSVTFADGSSYAYEYDKVGNLIAQTDALGNVTRFEYDALHQLAKTIYPDGSEATNSYDANGYLISATDVGKNTTTAEYDALGHLHTATDALGNVTVYEYDKAGRMTGQTLANGGKNQYNYNNVGQLTSTVNANGEQTSYTYDAAGEVLSCTTPDGGVIAYSYDSMGRLLTETEPNGAVTRYTYDLAGNLSTVTDALGNITTYEYDANGNLLTITDALDGVTRYSYDAMNRVDSMTDANGATTSYQYDAVGNLVSQTDALGNITSYDYDSNGSITALTDALGGKTSMSYDELGNVISVLQKNKGTVNAEYDPLGNLLKETDALGNTTSYEYNANGKVTKITDALGQGAEIAYDEVGNVIEVGSPDGSNTAYAYDLSGRLTEEVSPAGAKTSYTYDKGRLVKTATNGNETFYTYDQVGNISSVTDAEGRSVELSYDALGNLTAVLYPDGTQDCYEYDALSRLVTYTPRDGDSTSYQYNAMGDVLSVTTGDQTTSYEYDLLGRTTAVITADGARTESQYDALGNVTKTVDALGNATAYHYTVDSLLKQVDYANGAKLTAAYDLTGNLISEVDPEGATTAYEYDPVGRMTSVTDALGATTRYTYDAADNLTQVTDALGHVTEYTYDALGNLTSETDALGDTVTYTYTPEGWLETVTDAEGNVTRYTNDRTGNILTVDYAGEQTEQNTYNEIGLLTTVTTAEGVTEYQYDDASRLLSVKQPNGDTVSYTYDSHGNRLTMTYPSGKTVKYAYDEMNRLVSVKGIDGVTTTYAYDALGQRTKTVGGKETTEYTYDEVGDLIAQTTTGSHDLSLKYAYDRSGRMVSESRTENGTTLDSAFTYDPLGQLTGFTRSDGISEQYSYDAVGNMTQKVKGDVTTTMTYNAANQLTKSVTGGNTTTYAYDHNGNLTEKQTATGTTRYTYNALNLLQSYTGEDGYTERYTYNADRLLSSITTPDSTTTLTWDLLHGDGVVISETTGKKTTDFTYGLERISAQTGSNRTEYVYDGRGSVAAEVSYNNAWYTFGGTLAWKHVTSKSYTPFGEQIGEKTSGFGYNGEYYNAATGMIYLRARFYEPEMNRFSQKDLLKGEIISGTSLNRYVYCWNDPVNYVDRNGQIPTYNVSVTDSGGGSYHWNQTRRNQTPKTPVKPRSSGVSHPAQSNLQKTQKMLEEIHDQNPFIKSDSKKLFKDYTGIDVDQTDKAPYKSWDGNRRNSSDKAESYVTRNNGRTDRIDTAKPSVKPISGTQAPCSLWESMQQGQKQQRQVERIRKAANSDLLLRLMTNSSIGINVGFGLSGGGDVTFVADKNGDVYALIAVGAGGGLGLDMKGGPSFNSIGTGLDPDNVLKDIDLVDSIDERSGWGISVGGTATIISAELRSTEPNEMNSNFGITTSYGYDFHAHIIYSWAVKVGSIVEED